MRFSIVTTLYNSEPYVDEFYLRIKTAVEKITDDYEIIFVNDGSPDHSLDKVVRLYNNDIKIKIVDLSRNFGHHKALMTGLGYASGDFIFLIDSDLEEPPELLTKYYSNMIQCGCDVVVGTQAKRKGDRFEQISGIIFYKMFNLLSDNLIPENVLISRLMKKDFVKSLISHKEKELFFAGICSITGYDQKTVQVSKGAKGSTSYSLFKKVSQTINAIVSFSNKPLYFIFILGIFMSLISGCYVSYIIFMKIFFSMQVGFASIVASIWGVGGIILVSTGVIGIYVAKVFSEVKQRPVIVKKFYNRLNRVNNAETDHNDI